MLTTNGTLLDDDRIERLGEAGLDYLNISADVIRPDRVTRKCSVLAERRMAKLLEVQQRCGMKVRVNAVLYKDNNRDIFDLIEYTHQHDVPSLFRRLLGLALVPHLGVDDAPDSLAGLDRGQAAA